MCGNDAERLRLSPECLIIKSLRNGNLLSEGQDPRQQVLSDNTYDDVDNVEYLAFALSKTRRVGTSETHIQLASATAAMKILSTK